MEKEIMDVEEKCTDIIFEKDEELNERKDLIIQYRIVNNYGVLTGDNAQIEKIKLNSVENQKGNLFSEKEVILLNDQLFSKWIIENYGSFAMALMLTCAVFDCFPYKWIMEATEVLLPLLKKQEEERERAYTITDILSKFGARICGAELNTYTGKTPIEVVRLSKEEYREKILSYVWRECPQLQDKIIIWLKMYSRHKLASMSKRAIEVMGKLACGDYYYCCAPLSLTYN